MKELDYDALEALPIIPPSPGEILEAVKNTTAANTLIWELGEGRFFVASSEFGYADQPKGFSPDSQGNPIPTHKRAVYWLSGGFNCTILEGPDATFQAMARSFKGSNIRFMPGYPDQEQLYAVLKR